MSNISVAQSQPRRGRVFGIAMAASMAVSTLSLALIAAPASAARVTPAIKVASTSAYCSLLTSYENTETTTSADLSTPGKAEATIKSEYQAMMNVEPKVLSVSPSQLTPSFKALFAYLNSFYSLLSKDGFNYSKLTPASFKSLEANAASLAADGKTITNYDKSVCHAKS
jgi:hypothetical protein